MLSKLIKLGKLRVVINCEEAVAEMMSKVIRYINEVNRKVTLDKIVNVYLFKELSDMEEFIELKGLRLGVSIMVKGMLSYHEAWDSIPTLYFSHEIHRKYGNAMLRALVHHEVVHALLHGEIVYYVLPADLNYGDLTLAEAYLLFSGVKDFEVSMLLKEIGLGLHQEPLVKYHLREIKFDETLIKTILLLMPLIELFNYLRDEIKSILKSINLNFNVLVTLKNDLIECISTFDKFSRIVNWYLEHWQRDEEF